jgi:steroid delta-isomerase-like uncharacterized protein
VLLISVSSVLVGTVGLTPSAQPRGQDATPAASPATSPIALSGTFQRLAEAIAAGDGAAVAALYTEDGTYEDVPSGTIAQGRKEIAAFIEEVAATLTDVEFRPTTAHEGDGWAVWEYVFATTDITSGVRMEVRGATVFEVEDGLIRRSADYYAPQPKGGG